jgi:hypothetical protein
MGEVDACWCRRQATGRDGATGRPHASDGSPTQTAKDALVKRLVPIITAAVGLVLLVAFAAPLLAGDSTPGSAGPTVQTKSTSGYQESLCASRTSLCIDSYDNPGDEYVGHDEPSLEYKSSVPGSGNDMTYTVTLPREPRTRPTASGGGGTWNFQLRPTFWFGLTLCDTASAPEYTKRCTPDSDGNALEGTNPNARDYLGRHPGNAYMELQFYGPGYVPQFEGFSCGATVYCAAMTIDSRTLDQNTGIENTADCSNYILGGPEPINWAYVTESGASQAPANPFFTGTFSAPNLSAVTPDYAKDLLMRPGDRIRVHMHDTPEGFRVDLMDLTSGDQGSMTASVANGFGHILYTPNSPTCKMAPYAFHPEYSTANPRGNTWSAHTYNVAYSDEIGHFESCVQIDANFNCAIPGNQDLASGLDPDDGNNFCVPGTDSSLIQVDGCFSGDGDWDSASYSNAWPGTNPNVAQDRALHPSPVLFTSPQTRGRNYSTIAFETDLPRIEAPDSQDSAPFCDRITGADCVNPPTGAQFYPFFSTTSANGTCTWQEGGDHIPGTINDFGGSSTSEFGPLLQTVYPAAGFTTITRLNNFNSGDQPNPCPVRGDGGDSSGS